MLACLSPGLHAAIVDAGRPGYAHLGVARAGAADRLALASANLLCGNAPGAPALEMALLGATFAVLAGCRIALTGADMEARVPEEGRSLLPDAAHRLTAGTSLLLAAATAGARAYLALEGGMAADWALGSASTDPLGGFGGLGGRPLRAGDVLGPDTNAGGLPADGGKPGGAEPRGPERRWPGPGPASGVAQGTGPVVLAITPGPHHDRFDARAREALVATTWRTSVRSDRAGVRLEGPPIERPDVRDPVSLPMIPGAIEVPSGGLPIVLGPDGPTVGGYPVIGVVAEADLPALGQLAPDDELRFEWVSLEEARARAAAARADLARAAAALGAPAPRGPRARGGLAAMSAEAVPKTSVPVYTVRRSTRARHARLTVDDDGDVVVVLPARAPLSVAERLVAGHAAWIARHRARALALRARMAARLPLGEGRILVVQGEPLRIQVVDGVGSRPARGRVERHPDMLIVRLGRDGWPAEVLLQAWLREAAREAILERIAVHAPLMGVAPGRVTVRDQRTRWGSASSSGALSFSWRLVLAPPEVLDAVVVHELAHLRVRGHGPGFWRLVKGHAPQTSEARRWLREHAAEVRAALE